MKLKLLTFDGVALCEYSDTVQSFTEVFRFDTHLL